MPCTTFFGGTGGCALAALTRTLSADNDVVALARTPEKLRKLLRDRGISDSTLSAHLTIIEGNVKDVTAVKKALTQPRDPNRLTDLIISGIGAAPKLKLWFNPIGLDDPQVCQSAIRTILQGLRELQKSGATGKPSIAVVSTTGISKQRDVPWAFYPFYVWLLHVPHEDKRVMEKLLQDAAREGASSPIEGFVSVKASLLMDGQGIGAEKLRVGWEGGESKGKGPAIGYTVTRNDVGDWFFKELVQPERRTQWLNKMVTVTA